MPDPVTPAEVRAQGRRLLAVLRLSDMTRALPAAADLSNFLRDNADVLLADPEPWVTHDDPVQP